MTPHATQMTIMDMLTGSGPVVQAVLYILILLSVTSWGIVLFKWKQIRSARRASEAFLDLFWNTRNLTNLSKAVGDAPPSPLAEVFTAGYEELVRLRSRKRDHSEESMDLPGISNVERAMRRAASLERTELEKMLTFLATTASAAPFIGLFGTVWGIMNSFLGLSEGGASTIQAVAPGISEALIATATGLAAAIPALIAYNHYSRGTRLIATEMDHFISDFLNIAERHFLN